MAQRYNNSAGHTNKFFVYAVMQGLCGPATEKSECAVRDKTDASVFVHPQLSNDNRIVFRDNVPVFYNVEVPYVHQLQNVLHDHNENISIHMQLFKI